MKFKVSSVLFQNSNSFKFLFKLKGNDPRQDMCLSFDPIIVLLCNIGPSKVRALPLGVAAGT